jgi:hypothetical protein
MWFAPYPFPGQHAVVRGDIAERLQEAKRVERAQRVPLRLIPHFLDGDEAEEESVQVHREEEEAVVGLG